MDENLNLSKNTEIDEALKEFEAESAVEQTQRIPEVSVTSDVPKMVGLVMKLSGGTIKEQKQAEYVLLGLVVIMIAVSLFLMFGGRVQFNRNIDTTEQDMIADLP